MSVAADSGQISKTNWEGVVCVTGSKNEVTVGCTFSDWDFNSHLYVRAVLFGDEMETILRMRYDSSIGFATTRAFNIQYAIPTQSTWYYQHGETPADWYSSTSTDGWSEANTGNFPDSANQIQLYKKTFSVSASMDVLSI